MESQELLNAGRLHQLPTITCPNCQMVWLAPGLEDGDCYECKGCKLGFVVGDNGEQDSLCLLDK